MGLDAVELVMEVEDKFGVAIPDAAASQMQTVGDLYAYLLTHPGEPAVAPACYSQRAFHQVRRELVAEGIGREAVRPSTPLRKLLPFVRRRRIWRSIGKQLNLQLPGLRLPAWFSLLLFLTVAGCMAWLLQQSSENIRPTEIVVGTLYGLFMWAMLLLLCLALFGRAFPARIRTVEQLVRHAAAEQERRRRVLGTADATLTWRELTVLIGEFIGCKPDDLRPDTHFINDLLLD